MHHVNLIRYIVWYATQNGIRLTTNRLVKFLYLADLYHARVKGGETITGFPWRFVYYGPYCSKAFAAIEEAANENLICKETYDSFFGDEKEYHLFWCREDEAEDLGEQLHIGVIGRLQNAIKKYGDETPQLLDYVYFETEPMKKALKGDLLDFSTAEKFDPVEKVQLKELSPETIKKAREKIRELNDSLKADRKRLIVAEESAEKYKDDSYYQFLKHLDGEELEVGLKGTAKIQITE